MPKPVLQRVEPPFWWAGMPRDIIQVLLYGENLQQYEIEIPHAAIDLFRQHRLGNPNYVFLDIQLNSKKPGNFFILLKQGREEVFRYDFVLHERKHTAHIQNGVGPQDVVYLIMPDRFVNADTESDQVEGMREGLNRGHALGRHGGDLQGIINRLGYLRDLGVTALWLNPVLENDIDWGSYHGYSSTDFYKVDPRLGTNRDYSRLVAEAHKLGMKVVQDMVFNHCGHTHWMVQDWPMHDWFHPFDKYGLSNYQNMVAADPHAAPADRAQHEKGWFTKHMPDLNHDNPFVETYLTQNSIWWVERMGLNGLRMDTYPFVARDMMACWSKRMAADYPGFYILGECWMETPAATAFWQKGFPRQADGFESMLPAVTDFPLFEALGKAFVEPEGWGTGLRRLYSVHLHDFLYPNPSQNLIFADNHDTTRIFSRLNANFNAFRMALAVLLTTRGVPQLYYGTEILMDGYKEDGDGRLRQEFPGGWEDHERSAFLPEGRTENEDRAFRFLQRLLLWRKQASAVHNGKLTHYLPDDGIYVYFRHNDAQRVMVILNNTRARVLQTGRYQECMQPFTAGYDVVFDEEVKNLRQIYMPAKSARVITLK